MKEYRDGLKDMAQWLAVWRDGVQLVGVTELPSREVFEQIDEGRWDGARRPLDTHRSRE